jgi:predicted component of viral defense system (DUF524 family)
MTPIQTADVPCFAIDGSKIATIILTPDTADEKLVQLSPLVSVPMESAEENGETEIQLRENGHYYYDLVHDWTPRDLRLRCHLARRRPNLKPRDFDSGRIETGSFCGTLLFEIVDGNADDSEKSAIASALLDVRSVKLEYRSEYRGMLRELASRMADLVADARSSAKTSFHSNFEERDDKGWFQVQLELLREVLTSAEFIAAIQRIFAYPHERLEREFEVMPVERPIKWTANALRSLINSSQRQELPDAHPVRVLTRLTSVAKFVPVARSNPTKDTPENRFVKYALWDFHGFLSRANRLFQKAGGTWSAAAGLARYLSLDLEQWLSRPFFKEIEDVGVIPLGSPVLHRKAGYREILRWWLRFRTAAELSWRGGEDLFHAGQRSVAELYEYWLFFHLLDWFCGKFNQTGQPPLIDQLLDGLDDGSPNLRLKNRVPLGPFSGTFSDPRRRLYASFYYNREFDVTHSRQEAGSWSRKMHPDYTLTFWPAIEGMSSDHSAALAEEQELLVHIHLDAKYRVNNLEALFGGPASDDVDKEALGNYKRQDLLKMHAYRDAIKRSEGAYIIYPGAESPCIMRGFHEIIPGLGAFSISPDEHGKARGLDELANFLDNVLKNLCDRASLREQRSAHLYEALRERRALYSAGEDSEAGGLMMQEAPELDTDELRLPSTPEIVVLLGWFDSEAQKQWMVENSKVVLRLGRRRGALPIIKALSAASHILLHGRGYKTVQGLFGILSQSGGVWSRGELAAVGFPMDEGKPADDIFAVFSVARDTAFDSFSWDARLLEAALLRFANRQRPELKRRLLSFTRERAKPQLVSLADLEIALVAH